MEIVAMQASTIDTLHGLAVGQSIDAAVAQGAIWVLLISIGWYATRCLVAIGLLLRARLTGDAAAASRALDRAPRRAAPLLTRVLISGTVLGLAGTPGLASAQDVAPPDPIQPHEVPLLDRGDSADRSQADSSPQPPGRSPEREHSPPARSASTSHAVVVKAGDTLWGIAAARLPVGSTAGVIDASWRQWYRANRTTIGDDPALILPGQRLLPPDLAEQSRGGRP